MKDFRYLPDTAILRLDHEKCIGCGRCASVCPHRVLQIVDHKAQIVDKDGCMECGGCVQNCPVDALYTNIDDGCGCAAYIIASWISKITGKSLDNCGC